MFFSFEAFASSHRAGQTIKFTENVIAHRPTELRLLQFADASGIEFYDEELCNEFAMSFEQLPLSAILSEKIFCTSSGIPLPGTTLSNVRDISRPCKTDKDEIAECLITSAPEAGINGWQLANERGARYLFGVDAAEKFLDENNFDLLCVSNMLVFEGYQAISPRVLIISSAAIENFSAAVLHIDEQLVRTFHTFRSN
jgi:serine/threonine-protein phosphatase PP1 catalytic subunit